MNKYVLAIDATSIVNTGGLTHLYELLNNFNKKDHPEIDEIIIIGSTKVLDYLPNSKFFFKKKSFFLNSNKLLRLIYQTFLMDFFLKKRADILFSLTGDFIGKFRPLIGCRKTCFL